MSGFIDEIKVGDRITFRAVTRSGVGKVTRVVNGFWFQGGLPTVSYKGWYQYSVSEDEILEHHPKEGGAA